MVLWAEGHIGALRLRVLVWPNGSPLGIFLPNPPCLYGFQRVLADFEVIARHFRNRAVVRSDHICRAARSPLQLNRHTLLV